MKEAQSNNPKNETGTKTESEQKLHSRLITWFQQELRWQSVNRFQQAIDEDYYDSDPFTVEEKAVLRSRGQAAVVYNETKSTVDWLIGTERRTRTDFTIHAREESQAAEDDAQTKTKLLKYLHDVNRTEFERSNVADDVFKAGIGWLELGISEDPDDEPLYMRAESWRNMLYDSLGERRDTTDWRYIFRFRMVDLDMAVAYFPKKEAALRAAAVASDSDSYLEWWNGTAMSDIGQASPMPGKYVMYDSDAWSSNLRERVLLIECWYVEPTVESTNMGPAVVDRVRRKMRVAIMTEKDIIVDQPSPYKHNRFPFVPYWCYRRKRDGAPYGAIRAIRGPQDALNKRMSKIQHILSQSQLIAEASAFDDAIMTAEEAREELSAPDGLVLLANGGLQKIKADQKNDVAEAHVRLIEADTAIIRNAAGVTNENLGRDTNATSGIAVQKKQDQGSVVTAEIFDNLLLARQLEGEICLSLIEQYYNQQKVFAITGERAKREYVSINQPDPVTGMVLNDITARKCQFTIGERNWKQTLQQAAAESMMELLKQLAPTSPELVTSLLDVAVELFDLPNKTLILQRIRSVTGMTDPNERPTPEEESKRQENDQKRAEKERLENELQQEQINKLRAEVQKLKAAAVKDGTETAYAAMQGAQVIATMPAVAPIADEIMRGAGYQDPSPAGADPNFPVPPAAMQPQVDFPTNTSPMLPATAGTGETAGIETQAPDGVIGPP